MFIIVLCYDKLKAFEFECYYSKENKRPLLRIQDKVSKRYILQFRPRYNSKTGDVEKLSIEIGKLLKELLTPSKDNNIQLK